MKQDSQPEIEGLRRAIAKIIDPDAWKPFSTDPIFMLAEDRRRSLMKATDVLALLSLKEGGGLASCTDRAASVASQPDCSAAQSFAGKGEP